MTGAEIGHEIPHPRPHECAPLALVARQAGGAASNGVQDILDLVPTKLHERCPLFIACGANGTLPGNMHIKAPDGTPMANAMLSLLHKLGLEDLESFGDSNGTLLS